MIKKKRILISGGAGSIGSELVRQLSKNNKIYILDNNESCLFDTIEPLKEQGLWVYGRVGDIRNIETVRDVFEDFKPQIVINAAALKHVPLMELTPMEAIQTNVIGHYNLVHVSKTWECVEKFVFVSSDKVVNGNSIMGITKKLGEVITCNQGKGFVAVRFGNVMGSRGSLFTIWQRQANEGKPITVTHKDMERYFMSIEEAVSLVIEAAEIGEGGEVICWDMGKKVNILELATRLVQELKSDVKVTGTRAGEILSERLMTLEEEARSEKKGKFIIIK